MLKIEPMNHAQTVDAGPPSKNGLANVVAIEDTSPIMANANEMVEKLLNSRANSDRWPTRLARAASSSSKASDR